MFHVSLLDPYKPSRFPAELRILRPLLSLMMNWNGKSRNLEVLDSRVRRRKLFYKVRWKDYPPYLANSTDLVSELGIFLLSAHSPSLVD
jgi:hypothetical protein